MMWKVMTLFCLLLPVQGVEPPEQEAIAVVELFTSQGCSSCPPADRLMAELADERRPGVYFLSFHVDYWDYIGWRDPFAKTQFSRRQRRYAQALDEKVYTPQMVVNGAAVLVGSDGVSARRNIAAQLSHPARARLELKILAGVEKQLDCSFSVSQDGDQPILLHIALVEDGLSNRVTRGENRGRRLSHSKVVRQFQTLSLKGRNKGGFKLIVPPEVQWKNAQIIAYVQEQTSFRITGATALSLPATAP